MAETLAVVQVVFPLDRKAIATTLVAPLSHGKHLFVSNWFSVQCLLFQVAIIILYGTCTEFESSLSTGSAGGAGATNATQLDVRYAMFQDTHIMMVIGFGFLYTLLRRYAWSGVAYNFLITVVCLQFATLCGGFWAQVRTLSHSSTAQFVRIPLNIDALVNADYVAATVLISFGAVIGRVSAAQMLIMAIVETIGATANVVIATELGVTDPGGSMLIHCYGAAFGLAFAAVLGDLAARRPGGEDKLATSRHNGTFAMIGTLFLFAFWPSFNAALLSGAPQHRAVLNTVLSISASAAVALACSKAIHGGTRLDMEHVQNATLAGGVAIGAACDMLANPWGALLIGSIAGAVSTYGFSFLAPALKRAGLTDTCGIAHLHCMPGLLGGVASAVAAACMSGSAYSEATLAHFPGRLMGRSAGTVGAYQLAMTLISLLFGAGLGALTALLVKVPAAEPMHGDFYEDAGSWNVPFDEEEAPELDADVGKEFGAALEGIRTDLRRALEKHKRDITAQVMADLATAGVSVKLKDITSRAGEQTLAVHVPVSSEPGAVGPASSPRIASAMTRGPVSANDRFSDGSKHDGRAFFGSVGGDLATAGGRFGLSST